MRCTNLNIFTTVSFVAYLPTLFLSWFHTQKPRNSVLIPAPEVLSYEPISLATDMWSIGVLLYVLLTGCSPFGGDTKQETFCNISRCRLDFPDDLFEDVSEEARDLMRKLMVKNPKWVVYSFFIEPPTLLLLDNVSLRVCTLNQPYFYFVKVFEKIWRSKDSYYQYFPTF